MDSNLEFYQLKYYSSTVLAVLNTTKIDFFKALLVVDKSHQMLIS